MVAGRSPLNVSPVCHFSPEGIVVDEDVVIAYWTFCDPGFDVGVRFVTLLTLRLVGVLLVDVDAGAARSAAPAPLLVTV